tara:strand:- start:5735 stop:7072 length:1338 start_codon:yes stop_codon:yes gene_type:complete
MIDSIKSKILFIKSKNDEDITFDAINSHICNLNSCRELRFHNYYYINNEKPFEITDKILCKLNKLEINNENVNSYSLELYSKELELSELKAFINELKRKYLYEKNNKLDNLKYYFDEHHVTLMKNSNDTIKFSTAPTEIVFKMTQFNTNKSLKNVFGNHLKLIKERMDLFINNTQWYIEKGIPYTLGILLHGPPGTGKTSIIKAIAKDTNRHIFNIKLYQDTTKSQIHNLFFNENVKVIKNGQTETFTIPLNDRIYVLEDVDCDNELLLDRNFKTTKDHKIVKSNNYENTFESRFEQYDLHKIHYADFFKDDDNKCKDNNFKLRGDNELQEDTTEQLTLSYILNILDGILETPGRILIMTTNYPDKLDKALIRPGRIDINLEVGYCDISMIQEMFKFFYNKDLIIDTSNDKKIQNITPAQLNKILLDNFNDSETAKSIILSTVLE